MEVKKIKEEAAEIKSEPLSSESRSDKEDPQRLSSLKVTAEQSIQGNVINKRNKPKLKRANAKDIDGVVYDSLSNHRNSKSDKYITNDGSGDEDEKASATKSVKSKASRMSRRSRKDKQDESIDQSIQASGDANAELVLDIKPNGGEETTNKNDSHLRSKIQVEGEIEEEA